MKKSLLTAVAILALSGCESDQALPNIAVEILSSASSSSSEESSISSLNSEMLMPPQMGVAPQRRPGSSAMSAPSAARGRPSLQPNAEAAEILIAEMNAASDTTTLTSEEFKTALLAGMEEMEARRPQPSTDDTRPTPPAGTFPPELQALLTAAVTFYSYTDTRGQQALIALDTEGTIMVKWPPAMGQGGPGGMQPPMNAQ